MTTPDEDALLERDDLLAMERTELAWSRSGLALLAVFAILARHVWTSGDAAEGALTVSLMAVAALAWAFGVLRGRGRGRDRVEPRRPLELLAVSVGTATVALAGLVVAVVT